MRKWMFVMVALTVIFTGCSKSGTPSTDTPAPTGSSQTPAGGTATTPSPSTGSSTTGSSTPPATANSGTTTPGTATPSVSGGDTASKPVQAPAGAKEAPVTTADQADKVDFGMSFDDVAKLMGQMGKLTSETKDDSNVNQTQTYEYKTQEGGTLKVTFHNGKVLNKSLSSTK